MGSEADLSHKALEPMYSTIDPSLSTLHPESNDLEEQNLYKLDERDRYFARPTKKESTKNIWHNNKIDSVCINVNGEKANNLFSNHIKKKTTEKNYFLPDKHTSMINDQETEVVIKTAFKYIIALMEFNMIIIKFQFNHYLYEGFESHLNSWTMEIIMKD